MTAMFMKEYNYERRTVGHSASHPDRYCHTEKYVKQIKLHTSYFPSPLRQIGLGLSDAPLPI